MSTLAIDIETGVPVSAPEQFKDSIRRMVELLPGSTFPAHVAELRVIQKNGPPLSKFYSDAASLAKAAAAVDGQGRECGVYIGLNPVTARHGMNRGRLLQAWRSKRSKPPACRAVVPIRGKRAKPARIICFVICYWSKIKPAVEGGIFLLTIVFSEWCERWGSNPHGC